jgi:hypothetical protein
LGVLIFFFFSGILKVCELGAIAKFQNPRTSPSGRKVCDPERRNSGYFVPLQHPSAFFKVGGRVAGWVVLSDYTATLKGNDVVFHNSSS